MNVFMIGYVLFVYIHVVCVCVCVRVYVRVYARVCVFECECLIVILYGLNISQIDNDILRVSYIFNKQRRPLLVDLFKMT